MNLESKIISFLGDSITEGYGTENIQNRYDNIVKETLNLKAAYNYGVGGTRIAYQLSPSPDNPREDWYFASRACEIDPESDVIIVFGGTNDYGHGDAPFGTMSDTSPVTFCGALECLIRLLTENFPNSKLVFMTPMRRWLDEEGSTDERKTSDHRPLIDYVEAILQKAEEHHIFVVDLYHELGIDPNIEAVREEYVPDGLHPNDKGHRLIAELLMKKLGEM